MIHSLKQIDLSIEHMLVKMRKRAHKDIIQIKSKNLLILKRFY